MIHIVVDSTADLAPEVAAAAGITVVPILVQFGHETLRDSEISHDEFYARLVASQEIPQTAAPPIGLYEAAFRMLTANGDGVFSISLAGALSSTFNAAQQAARLVEGAQITCVETGTTVAPMGYIALAAAQAAQAGAAIDDLVALVEQRKRKAVLYVGLDTLRYLEKGGRIGRMQAFLGTILSVKPILEVRDGVVLPTEQVRTSRRVPGRLAELAKERGSYSDLSVLYTTTREAAEAMATLCAEAGLLPRAQIQIIQAGPALGTHVGPGALGIAGLLHE